MANDTPAGMPGPKKLSAVKARPVSVSSGELVKMRPLFDSGDLPLVVEPASRGLNLVAWAAGNKSLLKEKLDRHGGILFRNFGLQEPADLELFIRAVCGDALEYRE